MQNFDWEKTVTSVHAAEAKAVPPVSAHEAKGRVKRRQQNFQCGT